MAGKGDISGGQKSVLRLAGLDCADCAAKLEQKVARLQGVRQVRVSFTAGKMVIHHEIPLEQIIKAVAQAGYEALPELRGATGKSFSRLPHRQLYLTAVSAMMLVLAYLIQLILPGWPLPVKILHLLAAVTSGLTFVRAAWSSLRSLSLDMYILMTAAVLGALAIGEEAEAATVVLLFACGNLLQLYTMEKTRRSISELITASNDVATVIRDGRELQLPPEEIRSGDSLLVKPGERIAADGAVEKGTSAVDQAAITGESIPVLKEVGAEVFAGTVNTNGILEVLVTRAGDETTLARINRLVEEAQALKSPTEQFVARFARYYTPAVLGGALLVAVLPPLLWSGPFHIWLYRALVLLVISCPCALVISTPVAMVAALGSGAKNGVLIRGGASLEEVARIRAVAFDKTGTLTNGRPEVTDIVPVSGGDANALLAMAAAIEKRSSHPLAGAIAEKARVAGLTLFSIENYVTVPGRGATARAGTEHVFIGTETYLQENGIDCQELQGVAAGLRQQGRTVSFVAGSQGLLGLLAFADRARSGAPQALQALRRAGVAKILMLTGDHRLTAQAMAQDLGLDDYRAGLLPEDKLAALAELKKQYHQVMMVGDGINDAPALAAATVGVAMGVVGTAVALETADIALMGDDLGRLAYTVDLGRRTLQIIRQNVIFAVVVKGLFLALSVAGITNLW